MTIIAYTYEADTHCPECTAQRFYNCEGMDREGNEVRPVFSTDEWFDAEYGYQSLVCGTCSCVIDEYADNMGDKEWD